MIKVAKEQTVRVLAVHGWSGIILGLALYVVVLTGAIAVFAHDIGHWAVSGTPDHKPLNQSLDQHLRQLAGEVPEKYREELTVFSNPAGQLIAFFHTHIKNDQGRLSDIGIRYRFDPETGEVLSRDEGFRDDMPDDPFSALDHFLVELHVNLHAPDPWGLYLTGILGLVLLMAAVTGVILHRHLIKDMFLRPRLSSLALNARDRHNLAGTWGLPFAIILAITGAFYSFAFSLGLPVIAMTAFGGDQEKVIETLVGIPQEENTTPATLTDLDAVLADSSQRFGSGADFLTVRHWGRADAEILVFHSSDGESIAGTQYRFSGVTGEYRGIKPSLGTSDSIGSTAIRLVAALHFGHFSGLLSRTVWLLLGLAMCYVTISGLKLWVQRRETDSLWQRLGRVIPVVGYGLPVAISISALGFFLALPLEKTVAAVANSFLLGAALVSALGILISDSRLLHLILRSLLGLLLLLLPVLRMLSSGVYWAELMQSDNAMVVLLDLCLLATGVYYMVLCVQQLIAIPGSSESQADNDPKSDEALAEVSK